MDTERECDKSKGSRSAFALKYVLTVAASAIAELGSFVVRSVCGLASFKGHADIPFCSVQ